LAKAYSALVDTFAIPLKSLSSLKLIYFKRQVWQQPKQNVGLISY